MKIKKEEALELMKPNRNLKKAFKELKSCIEAFENAQAEIKFFEALCQHPISRPSPQGVVEVYHQKCSFFNYREEEKRRDFNAQVKPACRHLLETLLPSLGLHNGSSE